MTSAGDQIDVGLGRSTVLPDMDFETYSEAGYYYDESVRKWRPINSSPPYGIGAVGAVAYTEHPSAEVLSLAYDLKDGLGPRLWLPGMPNPEDLFAHIAAGGLLEAWNSAFEFHVWQNICQKRLNWPPLPFYQLRDAMAKARAHSLPGALGKAAEVLAVEAQKDKDGKRLLNKFSKPRNPTIKDDRLRLYPGDDPVDGAKLYTYNVDDIRAEAAVSARVPDLSPVELELWLLDQAINFRGVHIDRVAVANCKEIVRQAFERYEAELVKITNGAVDSIGKAAALKSWLYTCGVDIPNMQKDTIAEYIPIVRRWRDGERAIMKKAIYSDALRALEIRAMIGSASIKKLDAIDRRLGTNSRLNDLFAFCGADRTGRFAGRGPQPQNLPNSGPVLRPCDGVHGCGAVYGNMLDICPNCANPVTKPAQIEWNVDGVERALAVIASRSLDAVEVEFGDAVGVVAGCLRGLFCAAPGHELICSDYSAIEAVVLAMLAGEQWRIDVFRTHGKIYEMSAAKICGIPFEEFQRHKAETGDHHPMRKKVGKVAELASGYAGWVGAWKNFGADQFMNDQEIKENILKWRDESPAIVEFWGGQVRETAPGSWEFYPCMFGLEGAAVQAIADPGRCYGHNGITFGVKDDVLYCRLLSGRFLSYHRPRLIPTICRRSRKNIFSITYEGNDSVTKKWVRLDTYGGKLTENVVQATARDILTHAMPKLERAGYPTVLHVHDEVVGEVPAGAGSVEEFEQIMADMPPWAADWPIKAAGGWRESRYRKD